MDFPLLRCRSEPRNSLESKCVAIGPVSIGFQSRHFAPAGLVNWRRPCVLKDAGLLQHGFYLFKKASEVYFC